MSCQALVQLAPNSQTSELSNEVLQDLVSQRATKLWTVKVGSQKKADILGSRLLFSRFLFSNLRSSGGPGSIPGGGGI